MKKKEKIAQLEYKIDILNEQAEMDRWYIEELEAAVSELQEKNLKLLDPLYDTPIASTIDSGLQPIVVSTENFIFRLLNKVRART